MEELFLIIKQRSRYDLKSEIFFLSFCLVNNYKSYKSQLVIGFDWSARIAVQLNLETYQTVCREMNPCLSIISKATILHKYYT